eukprot:1223509-Ditylum_brightwellii.AAC.1
MPNTAPSLECTTIWSGFYAISSKPSMMPSSKPNDITSLCAAAGERARCNCWCKVYRCMFGCKSGRGAAEYNKNTGVCSAVKQEEALQNMIKLPFYVLLWESKFYSCGKQSAILVGSMLPHVNNSVHAINPEDLMLFVSPSKAVIGPKGLVKETNIIAVEKERIETNQPLQ